ncbi:phage tail protein [Tamlana carrageenivorans]|uniref:Phage tail protein n=2 Tax=Pseudotamlana carrageenivorans TaxID=2069432 RepID=A0A2I7SND0_9FLAO|nr:phage tail protein [Tamlana carrageenivorans]
MVLLLFAQKSEAQQEGFIGEVKMFAGSFAPRNWAFCDGQLLSIAQNTALFAIIGTTYGGDGRTTFALPDLRGRAPVGVGTGAGLSTIKAGERSGKENITLNILNMPSHTHTATFTQTHGVSTIPAVADEANTDDPTNNKLAIPNIGGANMLYSNAYSDATLANGITNVQGIVTVSSNGGQQSFNNRNPYLGINYIICLFGTFPSRN